MNTIRPSHVRLLTSSEIQLCVLACLVFGLLGRGSNVGAQTVPPLVNFQGRLANPDGTQLPTADYRLTFRIYDAPTNGTLIWGPQVFDGVSAQGHSSLVPVVQGYFNVMLGPADVNGLALIDAFNGTTRYVETTVTNGLPILPRQQILATPFAFRSERAEISKFAEVAGKATNAINAENLAGPGTNVLLSLPPVGAIISYYGNPIDLPTNWRVCDGSVLMDASSPLNGQLPNDQLPDLRERFVRGAGGTNVVGTTGGADSIAGHSHSFNTTDIDLTPWVTSGWKYAGDFGHTGPYPYRVSGTTGSAGAQDNRPRYYSVHFIIRIK